MPNGGGCCEKSPIAALTAPHPVAEDDQHRGLEVPDAVFDRAFGGRQLIADVADGEKVVFGARVEGRTLHARIRAGDDRRARLLGVGEGFETFGIMPAHEGAIVARHLTQEAMRSIAGVFDIRAAHEGERVGAVRFAALARPSVCSWCQFEAEGAAAGISALGSAAGTGASAAAV